MSDMDLREAARLLARSLDAVERAEIAADERMALYKSACVAVHAMTREEWLAAAAEAYDEHARDLTETADA